MKKEITLEFSSVEQMWRFWNELSKKPSRVSFQTRTITYQLSPEEVDLAVTKYNAHIIDSGKIRKYK